MNMLFEEYIETAKTLKLAPLDPSVLLYCFDKTAEG